MRENKRLELVRKVIEILLTCKNEDFSFNTAGWLARKVNTSPENLARAFKQEAGETLQQFMISGKISRSAILLHQYSDITVGKAAAAMDYRSPS